jgi:hypothetical protein
MRFRSRGSGRRTQSCCVRRGDGRPVHNRPSTDFGSFRPAYVVRIGRGEP